MSIRKSFHLNCFWICQKLFKIILFRERILCFIFNFNVHEYGILTCDFSQNLNYILFSFILNIEFSYFQKRQQKMKWSEMKEIKFTSKNEKKTLEFTSYKTLFLKFLANKCIYFYVNDP